MQMYALASSDRNVPHCVSQESLVNVFRAKNLPLPDQEENVPPTEMTSHHELF